MSNKKIKRHFIGDLNSDYIRLKPVFETPVSTSRIAVPVFKRQSATKSFPIPAKIYSILIEKIQNKIFALMSPVIIKANHIIFDLFNFSQFELAYLLVVVERMNQIIFKIESEISLKTLKMFDTLQDIWLSKDSLEIIGKIIVIFGIVKYQLCSGKTIESLKLSNEHQVLIQKLASNTYVGSITVFNKIEISDVNSMFRLIPMIENNANFVSIAHMVDVIVSSRDK
jgi:hypothetical protein